MLTLLCSLPALNKMMCPNQSLWLCFCAKRFIAHQLLVKTFPKVGHLKGYIVLQTALVGNYLCFYVAYILNVLIIQ